MIYQKVFQQQLRDLLFFFLKQVQYLIILSTKGKQANLILLGYLISDFY